MTYEEFHDKFHIPFTQQQEEAVRSTDGAVLLLAVPGSGKTTVLVARLAYMVYCAGIAPENILILTYTVSAARDMAKRFSSCFGNGLGNRLEFRTINGICAKVIQYYGNLIGKSPFTLVTENEVTAKILSDIFRRTEGGYATESDLQGIRALITYIKNRMLDYDEIRQLDKEADLKISEIYKAYCSELRAQGMMDYDDQMVYAYTILRKSKEVLQYFQNKYAYICVDEAQDTSKVQHEIIRLLAGRRDNLFMVGDEDQSIYGFRAAYPEALLSFEKEHPAAKVLLMEKNFRSDANIVAAADQFIQKNTLRHEKHMTAARGAAIEIQRIALKGRNDQYHYLAGMARKCQAQTAVLYRNNESVLPLVDRLERQGVPYRFRSVELTFFSHRLVQDIRNIICFAANPKDTDIFLQIYYKVSTYISKRDALRICEISSLKSMNVLDAAVRYGELPGRTTQSCELIRTHLKCMLSERADAAVNRIAYYMGYKDYLDRIGMSDSKLFILKSIAENEVSPQRLVDRLDELQQRIKEKQGGGLTVGGSAAGVKGGLPDMQPVILSTIHSSKGLEYDTVYLMDVVDGIFPENVPKKLQDMDRKERETYEEERRLFYVGVTRAKNMLAVFRLEQKSTFCEELTYTEKKELYKEWQRAEDKRMGSSPGQPYAIKKRPFSREGYRKFLDAIGDGLIVRHKKLGEGVIVEVLQDKVVIQFEDGRRLFELKVLYEYGLLSF